MTDKLPLPPLPEAYARPNGSIFQWEDALDPALIGLYSDNQMQSYGRECQRLALEAAAKACKDYAIRLGYKEPTNCMTGGTQAIGCEVLIRRMIEELK